MVILNVAKEGCGCIFDAISWMDVFSGAPAVARRCDRV